MDSQRAIELWQRGSLGCLVAVRLALVGVMANCGVLGFAPGPSALVERDVVVRYFLDEHSTDAVPTLRSVGALDLPLQVALDGGEPVWVDTDSGRGWDFTLAGKNGGACAPVSDGLRSSLSSQTATIEVVVAVDDCDVEGSRLMHVGLAHHWGFSLGCYPGRWAFAFNERRDSPGPRWTASPARQVLTLVFDSSAVTAGDRMRLYANGELQPFASSGGLPELGDAISLRTDQHLCIANRFIGGRTPRGQIAYGAIYATALTEAEIMRNSERLLAWDDQF